MNVKKDAVVYQIYPRSFCDGNGDGVGDLKGIISKLDYISALGVNHIWLSPVYQSPNDDNGYDISDYKAIQPEFGSMQDFDLLIEESKKRGIKIIMDLVINHTSDEHEWFKRAVAGEKKYRNYYIIRNGKNGKIPNNWGNFFAECPWTKMPNGKDDEYYLHLFSKKQPDLNWHNPDVLNEVVDIMKFWLDKGVAGFRCDVINVIYKNSLENGKKRFILTGQEHYLSTDGCHEILKTLREKTLEPYNAWAVGETVFVNEQQARDLCEDNRKELDLVFYFEHMECDQVVVKWFKTKLKPKKLMKTLTKWQNALTWNAVYFENHDQPRFISRLVGAQTYREQASTMIAGLLLTLKGTPFIYEGQEIGMTNGDFKNLDEIQDIESHNVYKMATSLHLPKKMRWNMIKRTSRDNARTPMQWTSDEHAGFSTVKPWLKINANKTQVNVETELSKNGVLAFWKKMIALRKSDNVLKEGSFSQVLATSSIYAFKREIGGSGYICIFNMSAKIKKTPKQLLSNDIQVCNYNDYTADKLQPFEFRIVKF